MFFNDRLRDGKSQAGSLVLLGCEEGIEDSLGDCIGNAMAGVRDEDMNGPARAVTSYLQGTLCGQCVHCV